MRRYTLCKCCACVLAFLFVLLCMGYPPREKIRDGYLVASGVVGQIEEKADGSGQKQIILSLYSVSFCDGIFPETNKTVSDSAKIRHADGILCYMASGQETPDCGETIVIRGEAEHFRGRRNPGGFDAGAYYGSLGLSFCVKKAEVIRRGYDGSRIRQGLHLGRQYMLGILDRVCGADSGVMRAVLLGDKTCLQPDLKTRYQRGGISHILAISGLHISFLGMGLYRILRRMCLPAAAAASLAGSVLIAYLVMTNASPSARRAGTMFLLSLLADLTGRSCDRLTSLSVSAVILALGNPLLLKQSGFLLSHGAILGLELLYPRLRRLWDGRFCRPLLGGLSVSLFTLPVLLTAFYEFPVYALFWNLLVIPLMGVVMAAGVSALLAGMVFVPLGKLLFYPVHGILWLFREGCGLLDGLPGNLWRTGAPATGQMLLYYGLLLFFAALGKYMTKRLAVFVLAGALWVLTVPARIGDTITVLDVGQGDAALIQCSDGTAMLIDGGSTSEKKLAEYTLLPCLKSQGIRTLSYVFLTHMDADHINGVETLIRTGKTERMAIGTLVLPALDKPDAAYREMVSAARAAGIRVCTMGAGDRMTAGGFSVVCMHPQRGVRYADKNAASLVLYLQKGAFSALFTGDLDGEAERELTERVLEPAGRSGWKPVTLLKAGHHGSAASCGESFLSLCRPSVTYISCGARNRYGHPDAETLKRLRDAGSIVRVTKDSGAVWLRIVGKKIVTGEISGGE